MNLNIIFDKIYVITIDKSVNRKKFIEEQMKGIEFEFFSGTQISNIEEYNYFINKCHTNYIVDSNLVSDFGYGHLGCFVSHLRLLNLIVLNKYSNTLILEDDIILSKEELSKATLPKTIPDLLYWGYVPTQSVNRVYESKFLRRFFWVYYLFKNIHKCQKLVLHNNNIISRIKSFAYPVSNKFDKSGYNFGTYAYSVSLSGACNLLELIKEIKIPIDRTFSELVVTSKISALNFNKPIFDYNKLFISTTS